MLKLVETVLERYGRELSHLQDQCVVPFKGFLQPVTGRSAALTATPGGMDDGAGYLLIAPLTPKLVPGDGIRAGENTYAVLRTEVIFGTDGPLWQWALCARRGDALWV